MGQVQERRGREEIRVISNTHTNTKVYMKGIEMFFYAGGERKVGKVGIKGNKYTRECLWTARIIKGHEPEY